MFSEPASISSVSRTKFRLAGGAQPLILVPVHVNGRGPFEFILDTGASTTILAPELAAALGVQSIGSKEGQTAGGVVRALLATADSLAIGAAKRKGVEVAIADLSHLATTVGTKIDGDIGYKFFKHFRLTINFRECEITTSSPAKTIEFPAALVVVKFRLAAPAKPLIMVQTHVNGRGPFQFAVDTGTSTTTILPRLARELHLRTATMGPISTGGAAINVSATRIESLAIDGAVLRDADVIVGEFLEMLGKAIGRNSTESSVTIFSGITKL